MSRMSPSQCADLSQITPAPPVPRHSQAPDACINLVHPGGEKTPAAANDVPPSKLGPRSSTNTKVMRLPRSLSSRPVCLPQLQGKERKCRTEERRGGQRT
ncbi:unnamed protein product [Pleuronectes platessa]|uniref:Uncharacterized protein n=1 Tax=Pleuronectes platessa TaxID=8262 RepID=A0A9N7YKL5_PLEPL|nr:unnamed protein product [Pleuronectes platessa]